jgi:hypothetical protein
MDYNLITNYQNTQPEIWIYCFFFNIWKSYSFPSNWYALCYEARDTKIQIINKEWLVMCMQMNSQIKLEFCQNDQSWKQQIPHKILPFSMKFHITSYTSFKYKFLMSLYEKFCSPSQHLHYVINYNNNTKYWGLQSTYACKPRSLQAILLSEMFIRPDCHI